MLLPSSGSDGSNGINGRNDRNDRNETNRRNDNNRSNVDGDQQYPTRNVGDSTGGRPDRWLWIGIVAAISCYVQLGIALAIILLDSGVDREFFALTGIMAGIVMGARSYWVYTVEWRPIATNSNLELVE